MTIRHHRRRAALILLLPPLAIGPWAAAAEGPEPAAAPAGDKTEKRSERRPRKESRE